MCANGEVGTIAISLQIAITLSSGGGVLLEVVASVAIARRLPDEGNLLVGVGLHTLVAAEPITIGSGDTLDGKVHVLRGTVECFNR